MLNSKKYCLIIFFALNVGISQAQELEYLPPVVGTILNKDSNTSLILTTADDARFLGSAEVTPYVSSVQIIDADMPWPPRWYAAVPPYTDSMYRIDTNRHMYRFDFIFDVKVEGEYLSFYKILTHEHDGVRQLNAPDLAAYLLLNKKMESIDTVKSKVKKTSLYFHDMRMNAKGERLVDLRKDRFLDLRDYTDDLKDTAVHCEIDIVQILDKNDSVIFSWDPVNRINPDLFSFKQYLKSSRAFASNNSDMIEWTRLTSATWDYDGNILYSMKNVGIGKISSTSGDLIWQINYNDIPIISGKDTIRWYAQHDFNYLYDNDSVVTYSLYSIGADDKALAEAVIFDMNKKTNKIKLVKYVKPHKKYVGKGQGNIDYRKNGEYVIAYGYFDFPDTGNAIQTNLEYGKKDSAYGIYQLPRYNRCSKAHRLENWPRPPRPQIVGKGDHIEAAGNMSEWTWYELSGPNNTRATMVGTGPALSPQGYGGVYCVAGRYGMGYVVSRPYTYKHNSPY